MGNYNSRTVDGEKAVFLQNPLTLAVATRTSIRVALKLRHDCATVLSARRRRSQQIVFPSALFVAPTTGLAVSCQRFATEAFDTDPKVSHRLPLAMAATVSTIDSTICPLGHKIVFFLSGEAVFWWCKLSHTCLHLRGVVASKQVSTPVLGDEWTWRSRRSP